MIQQLNSVDQYCCLFHIVHQRTSVLLSKETTVACAGPVRLASGVLAASMQLLRVRSITAVPPPCLRPLRS